MVTAVSLDLLARCLSTTMLADSSIMVPAAANQCSFAAATALN